MRLTHSELERLLETKSRKLFCQLLQEHLDYRGPGEAMGKVMGNGGVERTVARPRERGLKTIFGEVDVVRLSYSARGKESLFLRDAELNLPPELYSHHVQMRIRWQRKADIAHQARRKLPWGHCQFHVGDVSARRENTSILAIGLQKQKGDLSINLPKVPLNGYLFR